MHEDEIHLTVSAVPEMEAVVVAALGAVVRSAGVGEEGTTGARATVAEAFRTALERGSGDDVVLTARAERREYWFELHRGGWTHTGHKSFGG